MKTKLILCQVTIKRLPSEKKSSTITQQSNFLVKYRVQRRRPSQNCVFSSIFILHYDNLGVKALFVLEIKTIT